MAEEFTKNSEKEAWSPIGGRADWTKALGALFERPKHQLDAQCDRPEITNLSGGHVRYDYPSGIGLVSAPDASCVIAIPSHLNDKHCYEQLKIGRPGSPSLYTYDSSKDSLEVPVTVNEGFGGSIKAFGTNAGMTVECLFNKTDGSYSSSRIGHGITESKIVAALKRTPSASYSDANLQFSAADNAINIDIRNHRLKLGILGPLSNPEKLMVNFLAKSHHVIEGDPDENGNRVFFCLDNKVKLIHCNDGLSICIANKGGNGSHQIDVSNNLKNLIYNVIT